MTKDDDSISCVVKTNQTFDVMLNPRASFYLSQHGSIFAVRFSRNQFTLFSWYSPSILRIMPSMLYWFTWIKHGIYSTLNNGMDMLLFGNKNSMQQINYRTTQHKWARKFEIFFLMFGVLDLVFIIVSIYFVKSWLDSSFDLCIVWWSIILSEWYRNSLCK